MGFKSQLLASTESGEGNCTGSIDSKYGGGYQLPGTEPPPPDLLYSLLPNDQYEVMDPNVLLSSWCDYYLACTEDGVCEAGEWLNGKVMTPNIFFFFFNSWQIFRKYLSKYRLTETLSSTEGYNTCEIFAVKVWNNPIQISLFSYLVSTVWNQR